MVESSGDTKKIYIVSYTHWDREFRFDFETTRMWLVKLWDNVLETMAKKPDYKHFMMDGQFVLVDDYLEIRPEKEDEIRKLTADGRLQLGPWYTLPDSSSIHGESLIRNLMTGLKKSREFGGAMEVGYNVFSFGQISQLPQIYSGFDIDFIFFYKHMDRKRSRYDEFVWEAPDGTQVLTSRLGKEARWNFFLTGHIPIVYNLDPCHEDWQYKWGDLGKTFHLCESDNYAGFHFVIEPETGFHKENIKKGFEQTLATLQDTAVPEQLLFFDGMDFTEHHPSIPEIIATANELFGDEYEITHSTLAEYIKAIKPLLAKRDIDVVTGEMMDGPVGSIHADVCSVHPNLKRKNSLAENKLFGLAEPLATVAWTQGENYPIKHIEKVLNYLFLSQSHDSLHGIGPKSMCDDITNRLLQADVIAENVAVKSMQSLAAKIDTASIEDTDIFLAVFNSSAFPRTEVVEAYIDVPKEIAVDQLIIEDADGKAVPLYLMEKSETKAGIYHPRSRNMPFYVTRFHVLFEAGDVSAMGYKVFKVKWTEKGLYPYPHEDWDPLKLPFETLCNGRPRGAENEFVSLEIASDGALEIINKSTGKVYRGLNYFMDGGEDGNLYFHRPPELDRVITSRGTPAKISRVVDSPLMAKFVVETSMLLPLYLDKQKHRRCEFETEVPIRSEITLHRCSPVVEIVTTVDNKVRDHFLRVCFATGLEAENTYAGGLFDVNVYSTTHTRDGDYRDQKLTRHHQHMFMGISDGKEGLAVLGDSLRDYEIVDHTKGTIAQSIVRGVPLRIPVDNRMWMEYPGDESAQSLGEHTTRYGLLVHEGNWEDADVLQAAQAFSSPLRIAQIGKQQGSLPCENSFLEIKGANLTFNAFKKAEDCDCAIVRLYNPTNEEIEGELTMGGDVAEAYFVNLNEERQKSLAVSGNRKIKLVVAAKKIVSIGLKLSC